MTVETWLPRESRRQRRLLRALRDRTRRPAGALAGRLTAVAARPRFQTLANRVAGTMLVAAGISLARVERV